MRVLFVGSRWPELKATASALHTYGMINIIQKYVVGSTGSVNFASPHAMNEFSTQLETDKKYQP
jgi:hypothetical protein